MSEVRYEAHPAIFRMRPAATLIVMLIMLAGVLLVGIERVAPTSLVPLSLSSLGLTAQYVGVILFGLGGLQLYAWYAPTRFERFTITDDDLVFRRGFMSKQLTEVRLDTVRTLNIAQTPLQQWLDVGDLSVFTSGDAPALMVRGLPNPARIRTLVTGRMAA